MGSKRTASAAGASGDARSGKRKGGKLGQQTPLLQPSDTPVQNRVSPGTSSQLPAPAVPIGTNVLPPVTNFVKPATRSNFVNPYSLGELEYICQLYKVTAGRDIRDRLWSVQTRSAVDVLYLYSGCQASLDPSVRKTNIGAIMYTLRVVQNDDPGTSFLVHLKPKEPFEYKPCHKLLSYHPGD